MSAWSDTHDPQSHPGVATSAVKPTFNSNHYCLHAGYRQRGGDERMCWSCCVALTPFEHTVLTLADMLVGFRRLGGWWCRQMRWCCCAGRR